MRCIYALLAVVAVILSGCGGGSNGGGGGQSPIVGRWRQVQIGDPTTTVDCPGSVPFADGTRNACGADDRIEFLSNGTLTGSISGTPIAGTYALRGDALTIRVNGLDEAVVIEFSGNNNTLTFRYADGGIQFRDILQRL